MKSKLSINEIFHALGDPTRRSLFEKISEKPISPSQLVSPLDISLAAVMQHIQVLENCGLVSTEKVGRTRTCKINPAGIATLEEWLKTRKTFWMQKLDQLDELFKEEG